MSWRHLGFLLPFMQIACVSVQLGPPPPSKSKQHTYIAPSSPFAVIAAQGFDEAWKSSATGNTIAYATECHYANELSLEAQQTEALSALNNNKVLQSQAAVFNERGSLETLAEGTLDGVRVKVSLLHFKKDGCNYVLSYVGRQSEFDKDLLAFDKFKQSFRVP